MSTYLAEREIEVDFDYDPGQRLIMPSFKDEIGQEGIPESITINSLSIDGKEMEIDLPREFYADLEDEIMAHRQQEIEANNENYADYLHELKRG